MSLKRIALAAVGLLVSVCALAASPDPAQTPTVEPVPPDSLQLFDLRASVDTAGDFVPLDHLRAVPIASSTSDHVGVDAFAINDLPAPAEVGAFGKSRSAPATGPSLLRSFVRDRPPLDQEFGT